MAKKRKISRYFRSSKITLSSVLNQLVARSTKNEKHLKWPPDVFAICAYVLKLTGNYVQVLNGGIRQNLKKMIPNNVSWEEWVRKEGLAWQSVATSTTKPVPASVAQLWNNVRSRGHESLAVIANDQRVIASLLQLVALADEASAGVGITLPRDSNKLRRRAQKLLAGLDSKSKSVTLSPRVDPAILCVLPKQHTPRSGLTIRSLTHHLALHVGCEVLPFWENVPPSSIKRSLNLLLAPWPLTIRPTQFQPVHCSATDDGHNYGYVKFTPNQNPRGVAKWIKSLIEEATSVGGRVDGVVFPEASLSFSDYQIVRRIVLNSNAFLIAGVLKEPSEEAEEGNNPPTNLVIFDALNLGVPVHVEQTKHHRWRLDRRQIEMYGLSGTLDPEYDWWEHIELGRREVRFLTLNENLSLCCLVCEDLARQDPVAELVRSVGPNLVVALLMDAPQLGVRWPAKYASVLADDPGSSVLTLTSTGMINLSRPLRGAKASRSIGLWKDAWSDFVELDLPVGASGLLLNLYTHAEREWTVDGRSDYGATSYPLLGGIHPIII